MSGKCHSVFENSRLISKHSVLKKATLGNEGEALATRIFPFRLEDLEKDFSLQQRSSTQQGNNKSYFVTEGSLLAPGVGEGYCADHVNLPSCISVFRSGSGIPKQVIICLKLKRQSLGTD